MGWGVVSESAPVYGWAVVAGLKGEIAIIPVKDWKKAKATFPYQYLNNHPKQPASIEETKTLAEETWRKMKKDTINDYDWDEACRG